MNWIQSNKLHRCHSKLPVYLYVAKIIIILEESVYGLMY